MRRTFLSRLSYATVTATLALVIALGAGAYAAGLPKNSVKSKQIKAGAVKSDELDPEQLGEVARLVDHGCSVPTAPTRAA